MTPSWTFPLCPAPDLDWTAILARHEAIRDLAGCPQDPIHHAEGDVLVHTRRVCEALVADPAWAALDPGARSILFAACLYHDVAKPRTTRREDGRVVSPGHARHGVHVVRHALYAGPDPAPFAAREAVAALVRYHGLPLWLLEKADPRRALLAAAEVARLDHLEVVARADATGRTCSDPGDLLARIDLFRDFARESGCWPGPPVFPSDLARWRYHSGRQDDPTFEPYDDTRGEVVVLSGLPGAGKDRWLAEHRPDLPVVSLDAIRRERRIDPADDQGAVAQAARELARGHLRAGRPFAWNATNTSHETRRALIDFLAGYPCRVRLVYVEAPWVAILERNRTREHPVPASVLDRLARRLDVPDRTEAHAVEWVV